MAVVSADGGDGGWCCKVGVVMMVVWGDSGDGDGTSDDSDSSGGCDSNVDMPPTYRRGRKVVKQEGGESGGVHKEERQQEMTLSIEKTLRVWGCPVVSSMPWMFNFGGSDITKATSVFMCIEIV